MTDSPPDSVPIIEQYRSGINFIVSILTLITSLGAFVTIAGYFILNAHLRSYTDLYRFSILPNYYIIAGYTLFLLLAILALSAWVGVKISQGMDWVDEKVNKARNRYLTAFWILILIMLLAAIVWLAQRTGAWIVIITALITWFLFVVVFVLSGIAAPDSESESSNVLQALLVSFDPRQATLNIIRKPFNMVSVLLFILASFYVPVLSLSYGATLYRMYPSYLGGGGPSTAQIIFTDENEANLMGVQMESDNQSEMICLLAELSDGLLVFDPHNQLTIKIPSSSVLAVRDARSNQSVDCAPPAPAPAAASIPSATPPQVTSTP